MERKIHFRESWLIFLGILGEAELILRIWGAKEKYFQGAEEFSLRDLACGDPGIFLRGGGGGGGEGGSRKQFFFVLVLNLFYSLQRGPMVLLQRKIYFSKDPEGVQHFPGGGDQFIIFRDQGSTDLPGGPTVWLDTIQVLLNEK